MNAITQTTATDGQVKQINRFGSDAIEKVLAELGLDNLGAQRVIEHGDEFAEAIRTATITSLKDLSVFDKSKDEEVTSEVMSSYGYLSGYKPKGITEQTNILRQLFPSIGFANEKLVEQPIPVGAEGWFAIPKWQTIAPTYGEAVEKVLAKISETRKRKLKNWCEGELGPDRLKQSARVQMLFQTLGDEQKDHDILVVATQFGLWHRGRSVRRAREVMLVNENEYGLGAFAVGIMLLTHPERLMNYDDLYVDCAGDEYAPEAVGVFSSAPVFYFGGGRVRFDALWFDDADGRCGSASAFLPQ